jgi:hypothetical protein
MIRRVVTQVVTNVYKHNGSFTLGVKCTADGVGSIAVVRAKNSIELEKVVPGFTWFSNN